MRNASALSALVTVVLLGAGTASAAPLAPSGKWEVDNGEAACSASREFGTGENRVVLLFKPAPFWDVVRVTLMQPGKARRPSQREISMRLDHGEERKTTAIVYGAEAPNGTDFIVHHINVPMEVFAEIRRAKSLQFRSETIDYDLTVPLLPQVGALLQSCIEKLQDVWNVGEIYAPRLKQPARAVKPLVSLFSADDYPATAIWKGQGGTTRFVLLVDEKGEAADCSTVQTSGIASLDWQVCATVLLRGKFAPAIGRDGKSAKGAIGTTVRWVAPQ